MSSSLVTVNMPDSPIQPLPRRRPGSGCPVRPLLEAQPVRRGTTHLAGQPLWVQRLGLIVLPHVRVNGAWLCTVCGSRPGGLADVVDLRHLRAVDSGAATGERLPVGVFAIEDLELQTAFDPLAAAALAGEDFIDAWRVQAADQVRNNTFAQGLADFTDPTTLCVAVDRDSWAGVREQLGRRGGARLSSRTGTARSYVGFRNGCVRLRDTGFLRDYNPDICQLVLPPSRWLCV